jgi:hypothetical protein
MSISSQIDYTPQIQLLSQLMAEHDWYFGCSTNSTVFENGMAEHNKIYLTSQMLVKAGLHAIVTELHDQYCPWSNQNCGMV